MSRLAGFLIWIIAPLVLAGCASHPTKVDCEGKLRPINAPESAVHPEASGHEG
jgi:hypothetical protein